MSRKLSDWASIAEILSGVAVAITLILLVIGINENTKVTRASMYAISVQEQNALARTIMADPELSRLSFTLGGQLTTEFSEEETFRLIGIWQTRFRSYDIAYLMRQLGFFSENEWLRYEPGICAGYGSAVVAGIGGATLAVVSPGFSEYVRNNCEE